MQLEIIKNNYLYVPGFITDGEAQLLAKEFKEATKKAGKKAKENAKKDYVDRNFEYIKEKIKIEKKCPT
jgi:hypothetical protein